MKSIFLGSIESVKDANIAIFVKSPPYGRVSVNKQKNFKKFKFGIHGKSVNNVGSLGCGWSLYPVKMNV